MSELTTKYLARLSLMEWHDITENCPDPAATQCLAVGYDGERNGETVVMLTRYEDAGDKFALTAYVYGEGKRITADQDRLEWLWEKAINQPEETS